MSGEYKNFNDSPVPGVNTELDSFWLIEIGRKHAGFGGPDHWNQTERAAMLAAIVQMDCARTNAIALRNAAKAIADAIREISPEIAGAVGEAGTDIGAGLALAFEHVLKTLTNENQNHL